MGLFEHLARFFKPALDVDGDHAAEAAHLLLGELVLRVRLKPGIDDLLDLRMVVEMIGDPGGVLAVALHADMERLGGAEQQEALHDAGDGTLGELDELQFLVEVCVVGEQCTANRVAVPADVLGRGMANDVCAERQGVL